MNDEKLSRPLSELEGVALGIVGHHGGCTAYTVRRDLQATPSSHWRASAGSIYPLLSRLEDDGLIVGENDPGDARGRRLLHLTRAGLVALRRWIAKGAEVETVAAVSDPVRSRAFFLDALPPRQRSKCVARMLTTLEVYLDQTNEHLAGIDQDDDPLGYLGALGAAMTARARVEWMRTVARTLRSLKDGKSRRQLRRSKAR